MGISNRIDNWHKHWEGGALVSLQQREEIIVFKEAHSSVCNLKMWTSNALDQSFE